MSWERYGYYRDFFPRSVPRKAKGGHQGPIQARQLRRELMGQALDRGPRKLPDRRAAGSRPILRA